MPHLPSLPCKVSQIPRTGISVRFQYRQWESVTSFCWTIVPTKCSYYLKSRWHARMQFGKQNTLPCTTLQNSSDNIHNSNNKNLTQSPKKTMIMFVLQGIQNRQQRACDTSLQIYTHGQYIWWWECHCGSIIATRIVTTTTNCRIQHDEYHRDQCDYWR